MNLKQVIPSQNKAFIYQLLGICHGSRFPNPNYSAMVSVYLLNLRDPSFKF